MFTINPIYSFSLYTPPPSEFYDSGAMMVEEEGAVIGGLLVGLNVIDANLCIKGEDLDSQVSADTHTSSHTSFSP